MEREDLLTLVVLTFGGLTFLATGFVKPAAVSFDAPIASEARAWRRIWWPLAPGLLILSSLFGWWLQAPDATANDLSLAILVIATLMSAIWGRAFGRALLSLLRARKLRLPAMTYGIIKPTVVVDEDFARSLSPSVALAVRAHEEAHRAHGDPRRLWLAQLGTDLQWPWPQARARFRSWRFALELARDEEASATPGVERADLAEAVLEAAKQTPRYLAPVPALGDAATTIEARVRWLVEAEPTTDSRPAVTRTRSVATVLALLAATATVIAVAFELGDAFLRLFPGIREFGSP
jgi:hypothetical protein